MKRAFRWMTLSLITVVMLLLCSPPFGLDAEAHGVAIAGGLRYTAKTRVADIAPTRLKVDITVRNIRLWPARLRFGACAFSLAAYDNSALSGDPVWTWPTTKDPIH
jgi:hypothetical protein